QAETRVTFQLFFNPPRAPTGIYCLGESPLCGVEWNEESKEERNHAHEKHRLFCRSGRGGRRRSLGPLRGPVERPTSQGFSVGQRQKQRNRRSGGELERSRSGSVGGRGDHGPAHALYQDRGDRRPRPLSAARPAQGDLYGFRAWIWLGGFAKN